MMFEDIPNHLTFTRPPNKEDRDWWQANMPEGATPEGVAAVLGRGLPGRRTAEWDIDGRDGSAFVTLGGFETNARLWMHATRIDLSSMEFYQDGLSIIHKRRGAGFAQRLVGNSADLATAMGIGRLTLNTENVGGYMWVRAGALPKDWTSLRIQLEGRLDALKRRRVHLGDDERVVRDLLVVGGSDARAIRAIAANTLEVRSSHRLHEGDPERTTLGRELLIGSQWPGEIDLRDPETLAMFTEWRRKWEDSLQPDQKGKSISVPSPALGR